MESGRPPPSAGLGAPSTPIGPSGSGASRLGQQPGPAFCSTIQTLCFAGQLSQQRRVTPPTASWLAGPRQKPEEGSGLCHQGDTQRPFLKTVSFVLPARCHRKHQPAAVPEGHLRPGAQGTLPGGGGGGGLRWNRRSLLSATPRDRNSTTPSFGTWLPHVETHCRLPLPWSQDAPCPTGPALNVGGS